MNRELTEEEQNIVQEENAECIRIKAILPYTVLYRKIMDEMGKHPGWFSARIWVSADRITGDLSVSKEEYPIADKRRYSSVEMNPIPIGYTLKSKAAELLLLKDFQTYIDREYGYSLKTNYSDGHLGISVK